MNKASDRLFLVTGATGNTGDPTVRLLTGTNNLIEVIGDRTPTTIEDYVIAKKEAFANDGPLDLTLASDPGQAD